MVNKPKNRVVGNSDLLTELSQEHRETIKKAIMLRDILFIRPPSDKRFNKNFNNYLLDFANIIFYLDETRDINYSDDEIQRRINALYDKVFKNRRL